MEQLKLDLYKILDINKNQNIINLNIKDILDNEKLYNPIINLIEYSKKNKILKDSRIYNRLRNDECFIKKILSQDFKINNKYKYIGKDKIHSKIWILSRIKPVESIKNSDNILDTLDELKKKIQDIEISIKNPDWEDRVINKIAYRINQRMSGLNINIDNILKKLDINEETNSIQSNKEILTLSDDEEED